MTDPTGTIAAAADVIDAFSPAFAQAFRDQPFQRVDFAFAFAAGFASADTDDIDPRASAVIQAAFADRAARAVA